MIGIYENVYGDYDIMHLSKSNKLYRMWMIVTNKAVIKILQYYIL